MQGKWGLKGSQRYTTTSLVNALFSSNLKTHPAHYVWPICYNYDLEATDILSR